MTITDIKEAWKRRQHVIYNDTEYKIYAITVWHDEFKNTLRTSVILKDLKANSAVQVDPKKIERIKE